MGQTMVLPRKIWDTWRNRKQQIFHAEAVALPLATWGLHAHLRGRDAVCFVDNESACSSFIREASREEDVHGSAECTQMLAMVLNVRFWVELG